jgi:cytosine/adenosine deaminase-related metal-dependent hydrolase
MALTGALVVGPDARGRSVAIVDGRVAAEAPQNAALLACADGEIEPGAVCAHTHLYSGLAPYGMPPVDPPPQSFLEILERVWKASPPRPAIMSPARCSPARRRSSTTTSRRI